MSQDYHSYLKKKGVKDTTIPDFTRQVIHNDPKFKSNRRHEDKEFKKQMGPGAASFRRYKARKNAINNKMK